MRSIGKLLSYILLAINALFACLLFSAAYSPFAHPVSSPIQACMGLAFPIFLIVNILFLIFWLLVKYKFALFPLIVLIVCYPQIRSYIPINYQTKEIPEGSIKVLSYNVMNFNGLKKPNKILQYISQSDADIVCLQEYSVSTNNSHLTAKDIKKAMSKYPYSKVVNLCKNSSGNKVALYSKHPILTSKKIDFESQYNGSVVFTLKIEADTLMLINNHLESNKLTKEDKDTFGKMLKEPDAQNVKSGSKQLIKKLAEASAIRSSQAENIAEVIKQSPHKSIVVCGDFNDTPISYTHRVISENLNDAFEKSGKGLGISYNQNRFYFRIDHILTSKNIQAYNCKVDRSIGESDHYPIMTHIKIQK